MNRFPTITDIKQSKVARLTCDYIIGIDPGVSTGVAIWSRSQKKIILLETVKIHKAFERVFWYNHNGLLVRVEDARKRTWFGNTGKERLKGAGSVERDCKIWQDFLTDNKIDFEMVHPKNNKTKLSADSFRKITGWKERTSVHARDAAGLCIGF